MNRSAPNTAHVLLAVVLLAAFAPRLFAEETAAADPGGLETHLLKESRNAGDFANVRVVLEVRGDLRLRPDSDGDDEVQTEPVQVLANLNYAERLLQRGDEALAGRRSIRRYQRAEARFQIDGRRHDVALDDQCTLIGVQRDLESTIHFCPAALLSREDLDLLEVPGNSLLVDALLPGHPVPVGQQWPVSDHIVGALLGVDAVSNQDVQCELEEVTGHRANVTLQGVVHGAVAGVATEIDLRGRYQFDLKAGQVTWLALIIKEDRSIGHIAPGLDVTARLQMKIDPRESVAELSDAALEGAPLVPDDWLTQLVYESPDAGFRFTHPRDWHVIAADPKAVVMRLIERGELVAQCNVSPLPDVEPGSKTLEEFQREVRKSLGEHFGEFQRANEAQTSTGLEIYEVAVQGTAEGLPVYWTYFLVHDDTGRRLAFAFTVEEQLAGALAEKDRELVSGVEFFAPTQPRAARRTDTPAR